MKKISIICLALVMILSSALAAFAEPGGFVSSPSGNPAPELVDFESDSGDCEAKLKITPYSQRHTLDAETREKMEEAYEQIVNMMNTNAFSEALAKLAAAENINVANLAVSDLFDISYYDCDDHEDESHGGFIITLKIDTIDNFVGLLHLNGQEWQIVEITNIDKENSTFTFHIDSLSPFAIVVRNDNGAQPSQTGDNTNILLWVSLAALSGLCVVLFLIKKNKPKKENV